jgi:ABC-type nitrate/sulfonate/bicarbonate transport system substrate-binding protein
MCHGTPEAIGAVVAFMAHSSSIAQSVLRIGFVALADCAPLAVAEEMGLFAAAGLRVELRREVGWATIRDKIIYGELDAAQAPAGLLVAANCGLGCIPTPCLTAMVLNLHGNGITLSMHLRGKGVQDAASLAAHARCSEEPLTFGVVHHLSSHHILLRQWLRGAGLQPDKDVRIVVVPPAQIHRHLAAGNLDGFCVGEPWNSLAVMKKTGWCVATSPDLAPGHPEKVLLVTESFAKQRRSEHRLLLAALHEACAYCERAENRDHIAELISGIRYVATSEESLRRSLSGPFAYGDGRTREAQGLHIFSGDRCNEPSGDKLRWLLHGLESTAILPSGTVPHPSQSARWFRSDLYRDARTLTTQPNAL